MSNIHMAFNEFMAAVLLIHRVQGAIFWAHAIIDNCSVCSKGYISVGLILLKFYDVIKDDFINWIKLQIDVEISAFVYNLTTVFIHTNKTIAFLW